MVLRDPLTTLISEHVFRLALEQETERANRYGHGVSLLLFDVDNLSEVNKHRASGPATGCSSGWASPPARFFRNHDWVAATATMPSRCCCRKRPSTTRPRLATRFREMVQQRLVLSDHKTESDIRVTVSAAAVGTELCRPTSTPAT